MADVRSGHREHEVDQHAAIQGERIDGTLIYDFANAGILRFKQFTGGVDQNRLRFLVDAQRDVKRGLLSDLENNVLLGLGEALAVDSQRVATGLEPAIS